MVYQPSAAGLHTLSKLLSTGFTVPPRCYDTMLQELCMQSLHEIMLAPLQACYHLTHRFMRLSAIRVHE